MSNLRLELAMREHGMSSCALRLVTSIFLDELLRGGGSLGGEQSGHIIFPEISLAGDGMITAIELLRAKRYSSKREELAAGFTRFPQVILNVRVSRKPPIETVGPLTDAMRELERELNSEGRLLVRYSGTENLARIMLRAKRNLRFSPAHKLERSSSASSGDRT
jgi:phosphoglucosamine mutase